MARKIVTTKDDDRRYVSTAEAAARYSVSERTIQRRIWSGELPYLRVGNRIRIDIRAADEHFARDAR